MSEDDEFYCLECKSKNMSKFCYCIDCYYKISGEYRAYKNNIEKKNKDRMKRREYDKKYYQQKKQEKKKKEKEENNNIIKEFVKVQRGGGIFLEI